MKRNKNKTRITRIPSETHSQLIDSLNDLICDAYRFDHGDFRAIKRAAVTLRILFYDKKNSHSLITSIGDKQFIKLNSFSKPRNKDEFYYGNIFVASFLTPTKNKYLYTFLFYPNNSSSELLHFDDWWNGEVVRFIDKEFTRSKFITVMANQDGGAHFDTKLDELYTELRDGNIGFQMGPNNVQTAEILLGTNDTSLIHFKNMELAIMRQIVHEAIISLISWYRLSLTYNPDFEFLWSRKLNRIGFHFSTRKK